MRKTAAAAFVSLASAAVVPSCFAPSPEANPEDVERDDIATVASGACGARTPDDALALFSGPNGPNARRPAEGTELVLDGVPRGRNVCTGRGCSFECCDEPCGGEPDCTYALAVDEFNSVCLAHASFTCGGSDCSPYCAPFSLEPKRRYRFVGAVRYDAVRRPTLVLTSYCRVDG